MPPRFAPPWCGGYRRLRSATISLTRLPATTNAFFVPLAGRPPFPVVTPVTHGRGKKHGLLRPIMVRRHPVDPRVPLQVGSRTSSPDWIATITVRTQKMARPDRDGPLNAVVTRVSLPLQRWALTVSIVLLRSRVVEVGVMPICQNKALRPPAHGVRRGSRGCGQLKPRGARATLIPGPSRNTRRSRKTPPSS